ncbi:hypothetical protein B0J11DRAFT_290772 [Dendryphion nanum]|uniref:Zn(2)-C6 fungal-type domain-containing protein n=1 Tax=Dendryphion nanum TaxID=256645 RepID=A0A9P9DXT9_9PLEO|nr:hypothetical protein B0J11DRAFT_290772 [Dendryphion nanum]
MIESSPSNNSDENSGTTQSTSPQHAELLGRVPITRARPQLSCTPCRQGKLKCNREHPVCDQCEKRSRHDACLYIPPPVKNRQVQNMRGRIRNLENLVVNLINQKAQEPDSNDATSLGEANAPTRVAQNEGSKVDKNNNNDGPNIEALGRLRINNVGSEYVGAGHWSSLLKEIEEVKDSLDDDEVFDETNDEEWDHFNARSTVTFGIPKPVSKAILLNEMPPKDEVDRLLPLWFNSADPLLFIIHAPTFQEEYKQFWKDPSNTPVMWIALLYSIMALGIIVGPRNPGMSAHSTVYDSSGSLFDKNDRMSSAVNKFQQLASSAMVLADIAKSQPYTLETMMTYGECEFLRRDDHHSKIFLLNGVMLRVALRMGYHRDPSNFPGVSPFQGEMRRRLWHVLNMMDTLISFAIGLPTLIRGIESDVRPARNLYDSDFSPDMTELPKERPTTELTPALYSIAKSRVCAVFAEAAELSQKVISPRHSHIMALNKRLGEARALIPEIMRVRPLEDCITDSPVLIMSRFNIEMLYQKTRVVLHRNYLTAGQTDLKFAESREICLDAALSILGYQKIIFEACQPGGQLNKVWWYMSSLNTYDFLLAAMILCLDLNFLAATDPSSPRILELFGILKRTHGIWANHPQRFKEAARGAEVLQRMLKKCSAQINPQSNKLGTALSSNDHDERPSQTNDNHSHSQADFTHLPTASTDGNLPDVVPPPIWGASWSTNTDMHQVDILDIPSEIDWISFDSTLQGQTHMLPQANWASPPQPNLASLDSWIDLSQGFGVGANTMPDLTNPLNIFNPTAYVPAYDQLNF